MKRHLPATFISLSIIIVIIGINLDFYWSGMVAWGIVMILLILAAYFTKYIPNDKRENKR